MRWTTRLAALAGLAFAAGAFAQSTRPTTQAPTQSTSKVTLGAVNRDVQALYGSLRQHTVRVNVPVHVAMPPNQEHPLVRWQQTFEPQMLAKLVQNPGLVQLYVQIPQATTRMSATTSTSAAAALTLEPIRIPLPTLTQTINVEFLGVVLDTHGDVLVPLCIQGDAPMQVTVDDRSVTTGVVLAADRLAALSVIRLAQPSGQPAHFAQARPAPGSILLMLSPTRRTARLGVWTGVAEDNAILVDLSGNFSAIVRNGHALFPTTFLPVVQQLINDRVVKRAQLGVYIREVTTDDPIRSKLSNLGSRPAAFVQEVIAGSAAQRAGLLPGDLILRVNDEPVEDIATFAAAIANCRGETKVEILRDGEAKTISVDLQPQ